MVALDTLKVAVSRDVLRGFDGRAFTVRNETDPRKGTETETLRLHRDVINESCGINAIEIGREGLTVEVSAKILADMYPAGITLDTVERIPSAIVAAGVLDLDAAAFIEGAEVLRCDVAVNLPVQNVGESLSHLRLLGVNDRYHAQDYQKNGIVFTRQAKTAPERLTFYDKHREIMRGGNRKWIERGILDPEPFRGMLRGEVNLKNFRAVRSVLGVENPRSLLDVLSSDRNPVLTLFERVMDHDSIAKAGKGFVELVRIRGGYAAVRNLIGNIGIFERLCWDWKVISVYIAGQYEGKSNPRKMIRKVRAVYLDELKKRRIPETGTDRIAEIHRLLKAAA